MRACGNAGLSHLGNLLAFSHGRTRGHRYPVTVSVQSGITIFVSDGAILSITAAISYRGHGSIGKAGNFCPCVFRQIQSLVESIFSLYRMFPIAEAGTDYAADRSAVIKPQKHLLHADAIG